MRNDPKSIRIHESEMSAMKCTQLGNVMKRTKTLENAAENRGRKEGWEMASVYHNKSKRKDMHMVIDE